MRCLDLITILPLAWITIFKIFLADAFPFDQLYVIRKQTKESRSRFLRFDHVHVPTILNLSSNSNQYMKQRESLQNRIPIIVVGNENAALGVALALCAMDVLRNSKVHFSPIGEKVQKEIPTNINKTRTASNGDDKVIHTRSALPPAQSLMFYNCTHDSFPFKSEPKMSQAMEAFLQNGLLFGTYSSPRMSENYYSSDTTDCRYPNLKGSYSYPFPTKMDYEEMAVKIKEFQARGSDKSSYHRPIIYIPMEIRTSYYDANSITVGDNLMPIHPNLAVQSMIDTDIWDHISFLGLHLDSQGLRTQMTKEDAKDLGYSLKMLIDPISTSSSSSQAVKKATILSNLDTHLSMLQSNCLPKSFDVLEDCWVIIDDESNKWANSVLVEYQYNNDRLGGLDPLSCPSKGYMLPFPSHLQSKRGNVESCNHAYAAAYCAMIGYGMDPLSSLSVATSVKAVFVEAAEQGIVKGNENPSCSSQNEHTTPSYTWDVIDQIADYSRKIRKQIQIVDGWSRKKYRELDYK